jgi:hypothetical protein
VYWGSRLVYVCEAYESLSVVVILIIDSWIFWFMLPVDVGIEFVKPH